MKKYWEAPKRELLRHAGSMDQLAPVRRFTFAEGRAKAVEAIQVETGTGLAFTCLVDRALDLSDARWRGTSLCWHSAAGVVAPCAYERAGAGWLRGFGGGMLTTCGLRNAGPGTDEGWETFGLHGEISYAPASRVAVDSGWSGDAYRIRISGEVREAYPFGPNLVLRRAWTTELGACWLELEDEVANEGHRPETHMQLYHWNFGFPFLNEGTRLRVTADRVEPRDEAARPGLDDWPRFAPPSDGFAEQVFFHSHSGEPPTAASALLVSDETEDLAVELSWDPRSLPYLVQWKLCAPGEYVLGIEPATCLPLGRAWHAGRQLPQLAPGASVKFRLRFEVLSGREAVRERIELNRTASQAGI